jgi:hypothetical protein
MKSRRLADGSIGYYWVPQERDAAAGFTLRGEPLGKSYGDAIERAALLNEHLDAWREGRGIERNLDHGPGFGTMAWLLSATCVPRLSSG